MCSLDIECFKLEIIKIRGEIDALDILERVILDKCSLKELTRHKIVGKILKMKEELKEEFKEDLEGVMQRIEAMINGEEYLIDEWEVDYITGDR